MLAADARAKQHGKNSYDLMRAAGLAVAAEVVKRYSSPQAVVVVAGPGNNGGDGAIAAEALAGHGYQVSMVRYGADKVKQSDAQRAFSACKQPGFEVDDAINEEVAALIAGADILIDALLGAGLSREPTGVLAALIHAMNASRAAVLAVDLPSGVNGNAHTASACTIQADLTVTFFRLKIAHVLMPVKALCGEVVLVQIGLDEQELAGEELLCELNEPELWRSSLFPPGPTDYKYSRGHVLVRGGDEQSSGAARLTAQTALNCGAGAVTVSCPQSALPVYAAHLTAVMLRVHHDELDFARMLSDRRINTVALGPGNGVGELTRRFVVTSVQAGKCCVLDADALTSFSDAPSLLFHALAEAHNTAILTPHQGEFERLFPELAAKTGQSRLHQAASAAKLSQAVVVLKGSDTVIASPDGQSRINTNAPPWLATAGSGDVLCGVIASLVAMGMPAYNAACAGVYLHAQAANQLRFPMTAEQLCVQVPDVIAQLW